MQNDAIKFIGYTLLGMFFLFSGTLHAQDGRQQQKILQLVEWIDLTPTDNGSIFTKIQRMLEGVTDLTVRVTSPDIPIEKRRLWVMTIDGGKPALMSHQTGVRNPKWGKKNWIAYEQESDTNGDGVINFHDRLRVKIINLNSGVIRTIGNGLTPIWSPDGEALAFIKEGEIWIYKLTGSLLPMSQALLKGELVYFNKHSKALADKFWTINVNDGTIKQLPADMQRKYLWLGALSSDGQRILMSDASYSDIFIKNLHLNNSEINLTNDEYLEIGPDWSSDEKSIVFVSDRPIE